MCARPAADPHLPNRGDHGGDHLARTAREHVREVHRGHALQIFGTLHGYAFLAYVLVVFLVRAEYKWTHRMTVLALVASVPPLATVPFERWAFRLYRGH